MYEISRDELAVMIASHTCGISNAIPEQCDYDMADRLIKMIEDDNG